MEKHRNAAVIRYTAGLDLGASSVKAAVLSEEEEILFLRHRTHKGSPAEALKKLLDELNEVLPLANCRAFLVTGGSGSLLREYDEAAELFETIPAMTQGAELVMPAAQSLIGIGGQNACFISGIGRESVPSFAVNESCASGTGGFFEDQMGRLGLKIEDYSALVEKAESIPRLSGRCAVFAKTDIIHRQQEGVPTEDILLGLCYAMVRSYKASIVRDLPVKKPVALQGGVVFNRGVIRALKDIFELQEGELLYSEKSLYLQAIGAAREASARGGLGMSLEKLRKVLEKKGRTDPLPVLQRLPAVSYKASVSAEKPRYEADGTLYAFLGVDVGSTSTNLVLMDADERLIDYQYLRTRGNPRAAVDQGLCALKRKYGEKLHILRTGVTGSGRTMIGRYIGAQTIRDEITAQARSAVKTDPEADTVFEIGGQDSKYIALEKGGVRDFQMNKICAAGTGSFVEEQAGRLGIDLHEYGNLALSSQTPVDLGERCTVFVESAVQTALSKGAGKADIAAGLCLSVVRNYLHKVVGTRRVGEHIVLQGGVAYNAGIVSAFRAFYGDRITVSPYFPVSGAVGAALLAKEDFGNERKGQKRPESAAEKMAANYRFYARTKELFLENYNGRHEKGKKTVGIPRCLMMHKLFPMANAYFTQLGFQVLLSDETNEEIIKLSQQSARGEFCYPVKLMHGHFRQLMAAGVDYIFMPSMRTIRHVSSKVIHNYACPYMQTAPAMVAGTLELEAKGIKLLSPLLDMDFGQEMLAEAMLELGTELGRTPEETALAMLAGGFAVNEFTRKTEALGEELVSSLKPDEKAIVLVTRNYGIEDPVLNMGIPELFLERGYKVLTLSQLHAHDLDISESYPGLYWPFGQHILSGARIIRETPGLYAVYLTNHGCGPDTMISHLFREEMAGKPYLQIEVDEHFSKVGVITRVEAFLNSLEGDREKEEKSSVNRVSSEKSLKKEKMVGIPGIGRYGNLLTDELLARGYQAKCLPPDRKALELGRSRTTSKEYFTFTLLLGMALQSASENADIQLMLPSSEGADADGQYWRIIRTILSENGFEKTEVLPFTAEKLMKEAFDRIDKNFRDVFFRRIAEGDLYYMTPVKVRKTFFGERTGKSALSWEELYDMAERIGKAVSYDEASCLLGLAGEWPLVYEDAMCSRFWEMLEDRGCILYRMPLTEYLCFMWQDARQEEKRAALRSGESENKEKRTDDDEWLQLCRSRLEKLHHILGRASSFSPDYDKLVREADEKLPRYAGGGGRYRLAKAMEFSESGKGTILVSSMYENTELMLKVKAGHGEKNPVLFLEFDGVMNQGVREKLESFLYYRKKAALKPKG